MAIQDLKNIKKGTSSSEKSIERLIMFFEKYLPDFTKEVTLNETDNERSLTDSLWNFLCRKRKFNAENIEYPFEFQPEAIQPMEKGHDRAIDLGIYINTKEINMEFIYCLEAKKLPTGTGKREKEYVIGNHGGIERFKNEQHGIDKERNLIGRNGIVAYVHKDDFSTWHNQINNWIIEAEWNKSEQLKKEYFEPFGKLNSSHQRISGASIYLDHFWLKV